MTSLYDDLNDSKPYHNQRHLSAFIYMNSFSSLVATRQNFYVSDSQTLQCAVT